LVAAHEQRIVQGKQAKAEQEKNSEQTEERQRKDSEKTEKKTEEKSVLSAARLAIVALHNNKLRPKPIESYSRLTTRPHQ
jgi:hypothetical protein